MNFEFQTKLDDKIKEFRFWVDGRSVAVARLVQYSGIEFLGAIDVAPKELEEQIVGLQCEGFYVDWAEHNERIYLRVWGKNEIRAKVITSVKFCKVGLN